MAKTTKKEQSDYEESQQFPPGGSILLRGAGASRQTKHKSQAGPKGDSLGLFLQAADPVGAISLLRGVTWDPQPPDRMAGSPTVLTTHADLLPILGSDTAHLLKKHHKSHQAC